MCLRFEIKFNSWTSRDKIVGHIGGFVMSFQMVFQMVFLAGLFGSEFRYTYTKALKKYTLCQRPFYA